MMTPNRIGKIVEFNSGLKNYIWYVRNAQANVMATYGANGIADYYNADVASAQDYYPFGMVMPGRNRFFDIQAWV